MNRWFRYLATLVVATCALSTQAQDAVMPSAVPVDSNRQTLTVTRLRTAGAAVPRQARYGTLSYDSLFRAMPEYVQVMQSVARIRLEYYKETEYNAANFKRLFLEYLQGQQDFPRNILLKRQRDLQNEMERDIAFREQADSLIEVARAEMLRPVTAKLDSAIRVVGRERGYDFIINTDANAYPYYNPALSEDATPYVRALLVAIKPEQ